MRAGDLPRRNALRRFRDSHMVTEIAPERIPPDALARSGLKAGVLSGAVQFEVFLRFLEIAFTPSAVSRAGRRRIQNASRMRQPRTLAMLGAGLSVRFCIMRDARSSGCMHLNLRRRVRYTACGNCGCACIRPVCSGLWPVWPSGCLQYADD